MKQRQAPSPSVNDQAGHLYPIAQADRWWRGAANKTITSVGVALAALLSLPIALLADGSGNCPADPPDVDFQFGEDTSFVADGQKCFPTQPSYYPFCIGTDPFAYQLTIGSPIYSIVDTGGGSFTVKASLAVSYPGNHQNTFSAEQQQARPEIYWFDAAAPPQDGMTGAIQICGALHGLTHDAGTATVQVGGVTCSNVDTHAGLGQYSFTAHRCRSWLGCFGGANQNSEAIDLTPAHVSQMLGCGPPQPPPCKSCEACAGSGGGPPAKPGRAGGGDGLALFGGPPSFVAPGSGPGVTLRYNGSGVGRTGSPGYQEWRETLGEYWSHEGEERIVPDSMDPAVAWFLTRDGGHIKYTNTSVGGAEDQYEEVLPGDEYGKLFATAGGFELRFRDGTVQSFDATNGLWLQTEDRNGNQWIASRDMTTNKLTEIQHPDGTKETFDYDPTSGKLSDIWKVGVGVTDCAMEPTGCLHWQYEWDGDDLLTITRADGTKLEFEYNGPLPGYMTKATLIGTDVSPRVLRAWEYDANGNAVRQWSGADTWDDTNAVEKWEIAIDDPDNPSDILVRDPLWNESNGSKGNEATYTIEQPELADGVSRPRITSIVGGCPACGLTANSTITYATGPDPYLRASITNARGFVTSLTYDSNGMMTSRTDALGEPEERTTTWQYDSTYPALVTQICGPVSSASDCSSPGPSVRHTVLVRDTNGNVTDRTLYGDEDGVPFAYATTVTYTAEGMPDEVDPPGYGTNDVASFTYDPARGSLLASARTDPLIGATSFGYDPFNRRNSVADPSGITTETDYDELGRITENRVLGSTPAENLVTVNAYNVFGDLMRTTLPEGNVLEYGYDQAGRLVTVDRKPDASTPGERTMYELDGIGNRTKEELKVWDPMLSDYVTKSTTSYLFTSRCHLDQILHPDGSITEYSYDCNNNLEKMWDANHPSAGQTEPPTLLFAYDALDRVESVTQPFGTLGTSAVSTYGYDEQDHLTSVMDAEGSETNYVYSDRDLLTEETSPVSGTTTHQYNEHGQLTSSTDARGVTVARMVDELDRVTKDDYTDDTLDVDYEYDIGSFALGRLDGITRHGATTSYGYDQYGRMTSDGVLSYNLDKNSNITGITYPGGVSANYTYDFADRQDGLTVDTGGGPQTVVSGVSYLPSGPLTSLTLGNGVMETRGFDARYFPATLDVVGSSSENWLYGTDNVGNITGFTRQIGCQATQALQDLSYSGTENVAACTEVSAENVTIESTADVTFRAGSQVVLKNGFHVVAGGIFHARVEPVGTINETITYQYHDNQYFLTDALDGPWGDLSWTYDKIGNRLSQAKDGGAADTYSYTPNSATPTPGNTALLDAVSLGSPIGGIRDYTFGPAGHLGQVDAASNVIDFSSDLEGRLCEIQRSGDDVAFTYDGRSLLSRAERQTSGSGNGFFVEPLYDSQGLLMGLHRQEGAAADEERLSVFYLAGRPVAQVKQIVGGGSPDVWLYLTTDDLGAPLLATDNSGDEVWRGPFEPFGADPLAGTMSGALENGVFLRLPGQWDDSTWANASSGAKVFYNVNRWIEPGTGRYGRTDPLGLMGPEDLDDTYSNLYVYDVANPVSRSDPLGLASLAPDSKLKKGCRRRWERKIQPRLFALLGKTGCTDFFCNNLNIDLGHLLTGTFPLVAAVGGNGSRGGNFHCPYDFRLKIGKGSLCKYGVKESVHTVLHEIAHFADCWFNGNRFPPPPLIPEEGCAAETACFGFSIGENCRKLGYPYK